MAPRFDPESLKLDLSVADLLESPFLRSLGFSSRGGYERLWLGQAIHGRYQEEKLAEDPTYKREVVIPHVFEHRGWRVTVQGRADGLRREPDGSLVVEEIKSVRRGESCRRRCARGTSARRSSMPGCSPTPSRPPCAPSWC